MVNRSKTMLYTCEIHIFKEILLQNTYPSLAEYRIDIFCSLGGSQVEVYKKCTLYPTSPMGLLPLQCTLLYTF